MLSSDIIETRDFFTVFVTYLSAVWIIVARYTNFETGSDVHN